MVRLVLCRDQASDLCGRPRASAGSRDAALIERPRPPAGNTKGQIAGLNYDRRNLFRVENKPAVAARIAWLCRGEADNIRRKRQGLEEFLWQALHADRADFYESVEIPSPTATAKPC